MIPNLASYYRLAIAQVYGVEADVPPALYPRFRARELALMKAGLDPRDYAMTVAKLWHSWVGHKELRVVPIHVFLGSQSALRYLAQRKKVSIKLGHESRSRVKALHVERQFAEAYLTYRLAGGDMEESAYLAEFIELLDSEDEWAQAWLNYPNRWELSTLVTQQLTNTPRWRTFKSITRYDELLTQYRP